MVPSKGSTITMMKYLDIVLEIGSGEVQKTRFLKLNETPSAPRLPFKLLVNEDEWIEVDYLEGSGES